ncbi:ADP-ribosylation factor-like protein 2-binding protein isoform X2 [Schistocerca serialis cubense]|uniref:ADP-ribosylation factor-like protein 2-binding protein isoform X2 n=1 Tax=Schistocerca serialis cubense TaxID=2023355 RepID=UPI00214E0A4C|nr:ADP-ribosylation factor-like protein 2-binding protein isoform X2 [Schistocerca serialis cubense]
MSDYFEDFGWYSKRQMSVKARVPDDCDTLEFGCNDDNMKPEDTFFDDVIGHIEDVLVDQEFQDMQKSFMEKYWQEFHEGEENKLCYMDIFKEYGDLIENHIENYLANRIPHFSMQNFIEELHSFEITCRRRKCNLDGEVFEVLYTFTDFSAFKEMFLDYKAVKEGTVENLLVTAYDLPSA